MTQDNDTSKNIAFFSKIAIRRSINICRTDTMPYICVLIILIAACVELASAGTSSNRQQVDGEDLKKLALANNELAFNLNRLLISGSSENVFFSPFSISIAFAMLFYGTRGDTSQELRKVLGYDKSDISSDLVPESFNLFLNEVSKDGGSLEYVLDVANAILVDKRLALLEEYKCEVENFYDADVREVDFRTEAPKAVNEINDWVREKTHGKIEKLLDQLSPSTVFVLLDAVYFKGTWETQFKTSQTRDEVFYNNGLESGEKEVPLMHLTSPFPYASIDNFQALELPYKGDNISMVILLPKELDGLPALENSLTPEKLSEIQRNMYKTKVEVTLPKFKLRFEKELSPEVKALGAKQIFNAGLADFSGMTSSESVFVSQIIHKAVIEVNEEGSEAAAVTGIVGARASAIQRNPIFKADHPFIFAIVEKSSNMILFLGSVNNL